MSILSQFGIVILMIAIIVLIRESNHKVQHAAEEGELFFSDSSRMQVQMAEQRAKEISFEREVEVAFDVMPQAIGNSKLAKELTLIRLDEKHYPRERVCVDHFPFSIGRDKNNNLILQDLCVARKHCQLIEKAGKILIQDLGTANKIFAEGKLQDQIEVYDQLRFYIGNEEFTVELK